MGYDTNNVFAKILRGELPATKVYEDADTLAEQPPAQMVEEGHSEPS